MLVQTIPCYPRRGPSDSSGLRADLDDRTIPLCQPSPLRTRAKVRLVQCRDVQQTQDVSPLTFGRLAPAAKPRELGEHGIFRGTHGHIEPVAAVAVAFMAFALVGLAAGLGARYP